MTSATRTEGVGGGGDMEDGGMEKEVGEGEGRRNGWDVRTRGGREVERWKCGKRKGDREGGVVQNGGGRVKEVRSVICWRLSLQHTPEGLHSLPMNSRHLKTMVSGALIENESPREPFKILGLHPRHLYRHTHILQHQSPRRKS